MTARARWGLAAVAGVGAGLGILVVLAPAKTLDLVLTGGIAALVLLAVTSRLGDRHGPR